MTNEQFEAVWQQYFTPVYRYVLSLCRNGDEAQEITAECFFKAMQAIDGFKGKSSLSSWLCSIARNIWLDQLRRQKRVQPLQPQDAQAEDPAAAAEQRLSADRAMQLVHALPQPYNEVFLLRTFAQQSFRSIGALFGKSENWACVTYHRARRRLREQLEAEDEE